MNYLLGIDDTDTLETRGTGFNARQLAAQIERERLGVIHGITRHQNYVHPDIPYTSQNSSACLVVESDSPEKLKAFSRSFLLEIAPEGSDVGICMIREDELNDEVLAWGKRAKCEVLTKNEALDLAGRYNIYLEGLTGTHDGIIGALAAVGLRKSGNDGRFIWLKHKKELRELSSGYYGQKVLEKEFGVQQIISLSEKINPQDEIFVHEWFRPVLKNYKVTLIVEKHNENGKYFWKTASKDYIRAHS
jgi:tRNA(Ile2) C34 agmatinyltransferase TiaS